MMKGATWGEATSPRGDGDSDEVSVTLDKGVSPPSTSRDDDLLSPSRVGAVSPEGLEEPPVDRYRLAYWILYLQGMGMLFPWNVFITADAYFRRRFCDTSFSSTFLNFFGMAFTICNVTGLILSIKFGSRVSVRKRVLAPLWLNCAVFGFTTILTLVDPASLDRTSTFWLTLLSVAIAGICNAILQGGIFGTAAQLPPVYTQAIMGGQGLAGLTVSLSSIVTTLAGTEANKNICLEPYENLKWSAFAYFSIACVIIVACALSWAVLERLPFVVHYVEASEAKKVSRTLLLNGGSEERESLGLLAPAPARYGIIDLFWTLRTSAYAVWLCFAVTLNVFPTITAKIQATSKSDNRFFSDLWVPFSFLMFNLWDFVGRSLAGIVQVIPNSKRGYKILALLSTLRLVFIPLFLLSNVMPDKDHTTVLSPVFTSDVWPILFMILMALSNGYLSSLIMMYGPGQAPEAMDVAGQMMVLTLTCGLLTGSVTSFAWVPLFPAK